MGQVKSSSILLFLSAFSMRLSIIEGKLSWVGENDFKNLVQSGGPIADKTLLIKEIMSSKESALLITRPRLFGKTLAFSMLYYFLSIDESSKKLFKNFKINTETKFIEENMNKHPTIFLSFRKMGKMTEKTALNGWMDEIQALYTKSANLRDNITNETSRERFDRISKGATTISDAKSAISNLCELFYNYWGKPVLLLIDDYDTPIQYGFYYNYYRQMIDIVKDILQPVLKESHPHIRKAVFIGATDIAQSLLLDGLENMTPFSLMAEKFSNYFGFDSAEIEKLISHQKLNGKVNLTALQTWYGGFSIGRSTMFNPWAVHTCLANKGKIERYWQGESHDFENLMTKHGILLGIDLEVLSLDVNITVPLVKVTDYADLTSNIDAYYAFLVNKGYLTWKNSNKASRGQEISIPNLEIKLLLRDVLDHYYPPDYNFRSYSEFIANFEKRDAVKVGAALNEYVKHVGNFFKSGKQKPPSVCGSMLARIFKGLEKFHGKLTTAEFEGKFIIRFKPDDHFLKPLIIVIDNEEAESSKWNEVLDKVDERCEKLLELEKKYPSLLKVLVFIGDKILIHFK